MPAHHEETEQGIKKFKAYIEKAIRANPKSGMLATMKFIYPIAIAENGRYLVRQSHDRDGAVILFAEDGGLKDIKAYDSVGAAMAEYMGLIARD